MFPHDLFSWTGLVLIILIILSISNNLNKLDKLNVLDDLDIREGIKKFSDWPTIPQLYLKGEFIGGCDIIKEMFEKGELQSKFKEKEILQQ